MKVFFSAVIASALAYGAYASPLLARANSVTSGVLNTPVGGAQYESVNGIADLIVNHTPVWEHSTYTIGIDVSLQPVNGAPGPYQLATGFRGPSSTDKAAHLIADFAAPLGACGDYTLVVNESQINLDGVTNFRSAAPQITINCQ